MLRVKPPWSASVRLLDERDRGAALAICDRDPVTNVFVSSRVRALGLEPGQTVGLLEGPGTVTPVASPFAGRLVGLLAHPGERMREGQPIAWLRVH